MFLLEMSSIAYTIPLHARPKLCIIKPRGQPMGPVDAITGAVAEDINRTGTTKTYSGSLDSDLDSDLCGQALRTSFGS